MFRVFSGRPVHTKYYHVRSHFYCEIMHSRPQILTCFRLPKSFVDIGYDVALACDDLMLFMQSFGHLSLSSDLTIRQSLQRLMLLCPAQHLTGRMNFNWLK